MDQLKAPVPNGPGLIFGAKGATVAFMKLSKDYHDFIDKMDTHYPRFGEQYKFDFDYKRDEDDGKGL